MKLALIGTGLIGGSVALAWRAAGVIDHVTGCDSSPAALAAAQRVGVIDASAGAAAAVRNADLVLLAVPVGALRGVMATIAPALAPHALITDVGSTKTSVLDDAVATLGPALSRFVPAHPIAGGELPGVQHASATLLRGRLLITVPHAALAAPALAEGERLWRATGCRVERMDAARHDTLLAAVSHLPHLAAYALVTAIADRPDGAAALAIAGGGFRDFTRIAASDPLMWRDISLANRGPLLSVLAAYREQLDALSAALAAGDGAALERVFARAAGVRRGAFGATASPGDTE